MIEFRKATRYDREALLNLIEDGFAAGGDKTEPAEGVEHRILFSYLYSRPTWNPEWIWVAEEAGQLLAAAGYFPQNLSFEGIAVSVGAISPVVTAPKFRGRNLARKCLDRVMDDLKKQGVPLVFLWGLPFYYPRLGFVPVLPRYKTKITKNELTRMTDELSGRFRECRVQDLKKIADLYQRNQQTFWLQPFRSLKWWEERFLEIDTESAFIKEVPFPKKENFLIWENTSGELLGYLNYSSDYFNYTIQPEDTRVVISEAAAFDLNCARTMLKSFAAFIKSYQTLYIRGTPAHLVNIAAYQLGGLHLNPAPLAGMVKVIDWSLFLKLLTPLFYKRVSILDHARVDIHCNWTVDDIEVQLLIKDNSFNISAHESKVPCVVNHNQLLTKLIFGIYEPSELQKIHKLLTEYLTVLFPNKYPFIWDANYLY